MTEASAIQQDVEEKEVIVGNQDRNNMVAEIAERARQERDEEMRAHGIEPADTAGKKPEENTDNKQEVTAEQEEVQEVQEEVPQPKVVKLKVDGQEKEVTEDKVIEAGIRALQKESAADRRLEEATRLLREAEERTRKEQEQAQAKQEEDPPQKWDDATIAYALEHGSEEQKAYAIGQLRGRDDSTRIDPEKIVQYAEQKVLDRVDFLDASKWFVSEYSDIANDPYLMQLAAITEDQLVAQGDTRPRRELYKSIGDDLRKWRGGSAQTLEQKKEQKSTITNIPSASVKKTGAEEKKPKSTADIIEDMRKARGQR